MHKLLYVNLNLKLNELPKRVFFYYNGIIDYLLLWLIDYLFNCKDL